MREGRPGASAKTHEAVEVVDEAGCAKEEHNGADAHPRGHDLLDREGVLREGDGGNGLHGLDGHREGEDCAGHEVVDAGHDEGRAEVQAVELREGNLPRRRRQRINRRGEAGVLIISIAKGCHCKKGSSQSGRMEM